MGEEDSVLDAIFKAATGGLPYPYQKIIFHSRTKKVVINKSRRTGVSTVLGIKALAYAMAGRTAIILSPSLRQSRELMSKYIESVLQKLPPNILPSLAEDTKTLKRFVGGGEIHSLPNSSHTVRGLSPDLIVMDEMAHFLNNTDREVYDAVLPMLALANQMILSSTPFGDKNTFAEIWKSGGQDWERVIVNWRNCPRLTEAETTIKKEFDQITWEEEFENRFRGEVSSEFPMDLIQSCVEQESDYEVDVSGLDIIAAADIGRRVDFTAVYLVRIGQDGAARVIEKYVWRGVPLPEQEERLVAIAGRVGTLFFDRGGMGEQMGDSLPNRCKNAVPILFTAENKTEMWMGLKRRFEQKSIYIPPDRILMRSLNSVRRYWRLGRTIIDAERTDETGHADEATALALACWAAAAAPEPPEAVIDLGTSPTPDSFGRRRW